MRKYRVYRKLLLSPIVYDQGSSDGDYAYIKNYHHIIEEDFRKYLDWTFQLYRNGALVIPNEAYKPSEVFPNTTTLSDMILQFNGLVREQLLLDKLHRTAEDVIRIDESQYQTLVERLIQEKADGWSKEYREADKKRVSYDLLQEMKRFKMAKVEEKQIILLPLIGKIIGDYPEDFGGETDE